MNTYQFKVENDDIGITPVENLFINHYMPQARGDYVKVYLFGLKASFSQGNMPMDNAALADLFGMTEGDVIRAWEYWQKEAVLKVTYKGPDDIFITYYNITASLISHKKEVTVEKKEALPAADQKIAVMVEKIQAMYGSRTISRDDLQMFNEWITLYHFTPETIILLAEHSLNIINAKNKEFTARQITKYMSAVADSWHKAGIRDYNEANAYLNRSGKIRKVYYDIFKYLGLNRQPIVWEKQMMEKWISEYHYSFEMIQEALKRSTKTDLRYIDGIIKKWNEKGYKTLEEIQAEPHQTGKKNQQQAKGDTADEPFAEERNAAYDDFEQEWIRSVVDDG